MQSSRVGDPSASTLYPRTSRRAEIVKVLTGYVDDDALAADRGPAARRARPCTSSTGPRSCRTGSGATAS